MYTYEVKRVKKIVDGDTLDLEIDLGFSIVITQRVRLLGIDAPESRTRDLSEKELGLKSKEWLSDKLLSAKKITIKTTKEDKYGRILGTLHIDESTTSVNEIMLSEGLAREYIV